MNRLVIIQRILLLYLDTKISLAEVAKYLPNLTTLFYKNGFGLEQLEKMTVKLDKLKVLRIGVVKGMGHAKGRRRDKKKQADPISQLVDLIHAFKKFAPNLEV